VVLTVAMFHGLLLPRSAGGFGGSRGFYFHIILFFSVDTVLLIVQELVVVRRQNAELRMQSLKAQLYALQQQVSPHFLFNSLSTLKTMVPEQATKTYIIQLANVYRYLLTFHESLKITLKEEMAFMSSYLYILQERFEDALQIEIDIQAGSLLSYIPPISLQILVENAVKHNVVSFEQPLKIRIYTDAGDHLVVENTYQPRLSVEESVGKGLRNVNERYHLLAGQQITVNRDESRFTVILPLLAP